MGNVRDGPNELYGLINDFREIMITISKWGCVMSQFYDFMTHLVHFRRAPILRMNEDAMGHNNLY